MKKLILTFALLVSALCLNAQISDVNGATLQWNTTQGGANNNTLEYEFPSNGGWARYINFKNVTTNLSAGIGVLGNTTSNEIKHLFIDATGNPNTSNLNQLRVYPNGDLGYNGVINSLNSQWDATSNANFRLSYDNNNSGSGSYIIYSGGISSSNEVFRINNNGNVGIGTTNPVYGKLVVKQSTDNTNFDGIAIAKSNSSEVGFLQIDSNSSFQIKNGVNSQRDIILNGNANATGNIGIGTSNPSEKLTVKGKILCGEVEVVLENTIPADYVFQKYYTGESNLKADYTMPTLEEVEAYTKANHHLPEIPSAAEIKEDGLQLKEMTNLLLQKVEELTLYTIEQEKRIKTLESKIAEQK